MDTDEHSQDIDQRIAHMETTISELRDRCFDNSAFQLANDLARLARREQRLRPLLKAQFDIVNVAQHLFQHRRGREVSVEMIALLENPERARQIQANYSEQEYAETCAWMTACAYDNLAKHTGEISGYNSDGMHQCIADGISVCHRTGKLRCVNCFRMYAADVYLAADDVDMALHYVSLVVSLPENDPGSERRWAAAKERARILALTGELAAARDTLVASLELAKSYHSPLAARLETLAQLESMLWLLGEQGSFSDLTGEPPGGRGLPVGENALFDSRWDYRDATIACCQADFERAIEILSRWDQRLLQDNLSPEWFEARLRLIAAHRLAGHDAQAAELAQPLRKRAQTARDWVTVRRLDRLTDVDAFPTPIAMLAAPRVGPFASASKPVAFDGQGDAPEANSGSEADESQEADELEESGEDGPSPLVQRLQQIVEELNTSEDGSNRPALLESVLAIPVEQFVDPMDAALFLNLLPILMSEGAPYEAVWNWGEAVAANFPQTSFIVNLLAWLGNAVCSAEDSDMGERTGTARIDALFRKSLDLDPDNASNHGRAAAFYHDQGNLGEAERCLARAFRLQRSHGETALRLAEIYRMTDRPRDGLAALDLCLREGCDDPEVAWDAAVAACSVEQYESLLTYIDRYEALLPDQPWVGYYRAIGHLEQGEPEKALEALDLEEQRSPERPFGTEILRACAASALGQPERYRAHLEGVLSVAWSSVDYFTALGLQNLCNRLWNAASCLPDGDPAVTRLLRRLLLAGLAPDPSFEPRRMASGTEEAVSFYRCVLRQPLDERWAEFEGRLNAQEDWTEYLCLWGVLAPDEEAAGGMALSEQAACYDLPATVEAVECVAENINDVPGIVWQGVRWYDEAVLVEDDTSVKGDGA